MTRPRPIPASLRTPLRRGTLAVLLLFVPLLGSCETAGNLIYEPETSDPLDGYEGSLPQVGINTEMDWGPKQSTLLSQYEELLQLRSKLEKDNQSLQAENQRLQSQLVGEQASLDKERGVRSQAEAEADRLRKALRERDAKILSLSIEKAKLEQDRLRAQIAELDHAMQEIAPGAAEASVGNGSIGGGRRQ